MKGYDSICCFRNRHDDGYRILLEVTNRCNENCVFCHAKDKNTLSLEQISTIIGHLKQIKIHDVILTGGEPLLHKQFSEILFACCKKTLSDELLFLFDLHSIFSLLQKFFPMKALILGGLIYELVRGLLKILLRKE